MELKLSLSRSEGEKTSGEKERPIENVVIIGGGPAGLSAAIYTARAALSPLVLIGQSLGGQAATTERMENYPGFPKSIGGQELTQAMYAQAEHFGARFEWDEVTTADLSTRPFVLTTWGGQIQTLALIICTGAQPRRLNVPGEQKFTGRGVSYCATCDGFFYRDKEVIVIGGGDSAVEEGIFLTRFARRVTVVHRRDTLRASKILQERAFANPKISFIWNTVVEEILGDNNVTGVQARNLKTGDIQIIPADGVFIYVGTIPNTALFRGQLELNEQGYIVTDRLQRTSVPGVFAAGDVQDPFFRQAVIAAGTGAAAAISAERYLAELQK